MSPRTIASQSDKEHKNCRKPVLRASERIRLRRGSESLLSKECFCQAAVNRNYMAGGLCALVAGEPDNRICAILWKNRLSRQRALCIESGQLSSEFFRGFRF